jgi:PAS domain S-box-containing protein
MSVSLFPVSTPVRVLLLEDNEIEAEVVESVLRQYAFDVHRAGRLDDALIALRSEEFDVILSDLGLPDSTGLATLDALRQHAPAMPVVVMTGRGDETTALQAVASGAQDYLVKGSTDANALVRAIRYAVERGRAAEELSVSEARMRSILESALDAVVTINHDGLIVRWNRSAEEIFGRRREEVLGRPMAELIIPKRFRANHRRAMRAFLETGDTSFIGRRVEWVALRGDGSEFPVEVRINAEADSSGMTFTAFISDITERRASEVALDQLRRRYELILDSICDGVHGVDLAGNFIFENPAAAAMLGWKRTELIGRPAHQTTHHTRADGSPRPVSECTMHATLADGRVRTSIDDVFWRKDGSPVRVEYTSAPMVDEQGRITGAVVTFRDISKQKQMEQQIEQAARVASLGRVSASVAHEFNNLLMSLSPFAEALRRKAQEDPSLEKPVRHVVNAVRRGQRLTDEILRFTNPAEPRLEKVDLAAMLRELGDEVRGVLADRQVEIDVAPMLETRADADQLAQVLLNLVTNARDATKRGGLVTIGAAPALALPFLRDQLADPEHFVAFYVRDDGSGISADARQHIFEPFFTTGKRHGTGLGLAIAFRIAASHGGHILCDSEVGTGTTFYVVLPRA